MNIEKGEILKLLKNDNSLSQRELSRLTGYSLGKVNKIINHLIDAGLIKDNEITKDGQDLIKNSSVSSAIILAAGYGVRMIPINNDIPKALVTVKGEVLIERLIKQLHEKNIFNIYVVVGFMKEQFEYLIDKYDVKLIVNKDYKLYNNCYSLYTAKKYINQNTYIIPGDLYFQVNPFSKIEFVSYYSVGEVSEKGYYGISKKGLLLDKKRSNEYLKAVGLAYITKKDTNALLTNLSKVVNDNPLGYWEEAIFGEESVNVYAKSFSESDYFEINEYEDLKKLDSKSKDLIDDYMEIIMDSLDCDLLDIKNVSVLKKGMTNRSFFFEVDGIKYIMRVPGEGTDELISRKNEASVYSEIGKTGICDEIIYFNEVNGIKVTKYFGNSHNCDSENEYEVNMCMNKLREFHESNFIVPHKFDLEENILKYEKLFGGKSLYRDYENTKGLIFDTLSIISKLPKDYCLCHIDSVPDNFLINDVNDIKLIDWEYAGMNDPHVDIAMFAIYASYDKEWIDKIIDFYFDNKCLDEVRYKIYAYVAICGFLWSNWCEFKYSLGVEFGEYSLNQYRYAKKYSKIALAFFKEGKKYE